MSLDDLRRRGEARARKDQWRAFAKHMGCPPTWVSAKTSIKRAKVPNIDTDRLERRRAQVLFDVTWCSRQYPNRINFVMRAAELLAIEDELVARGVLTEETRRTRR